MTGKIAEDRDAWLGMEGNLLKELKKNSNINRLLIGCNNKMKY